MTRTVLRFAALVVVAASLSGCAAAISYRKGFDAGKRNDWDAAVAHYREAAKVYQNLTLLTPDDPQVFLQLGVASQSANDIEAAIAAYRQFLALAPDDASAPLVKQQLKILVAQQKAGSSLLPSG